MEFLVPKVFFWETHTGGILLDLRDWSLTFSTDLDCLSSGLYTGGLGTFRILSSKKWIHTPMTGGLIHWQLDQIFYSLGIQFCSVKIWSFGSDEDDLFLGTKIGQPSAGRLTKRDRKGFAQKLGTQNPVVNHHLIPSSLSSKKTDMLRSSPWQFSADSTATSSGSPSCS